jgi:hypothetical protein
MPNKKCFPLEILPVAYKKGHIMNKIKPIKEGDKIDRHFTIKKKLSYSTSCSIAPYYKPIL